MLAVQIHFPRRHLRYQLACVTASLNYTVLEYLFVIVHGYHVVGKAHIQNVCGAARILQADSVPGMGCDCFRVAMCCNMIRVACFVITLLLCSTQTNFGEEQHNKPIIVNFKICLTYTGRLPGVSMEYVLEVNHFSRDSPGGSATNRNKQEYKLKHEPPPMLGISFTS